MCGLRGELGTEIKTKRQRTSRLPTGLNSPPRSTVSSHVLYLTNSIYRQVKVGVITCESHGMRLSSLVEKQARQRSGYLRYFHWNNIPSDCDFWASEFMKTVLLYPHNAPSPCRPFQAICSHSNVLRRLGSIQKSEVLAMCNNVCLGDQNFSYVSCSSSLAVPMFDVPVAARRFAHNKFETSHSTHPINSCTLQTPL